MEHVKFVSYDGKRPNLCDGTLVLNIDGTDYSFGFTTVPGMSKCDFPMFWRSGGSATFDSGRHPNVTSGRWRINYLGLPEQFRKYADEIDDVFNDNVPYGCCGGCL